MAKMSKCNRSNKKRGGSVWQYTSAVYGDADKQVATSLGGNEIAANNLSGQNFCGGVKGGRRSRGRHNKRGGNILTDVAVPAVLLYANNTVRFGKNKSRRNRKSRKYSR